MCVISGRMPDGMQVLCIHTWRAYQESPSGEILDQVYQIQKYSGERVSNLVLMGTGEPMDNYDNVLKFIHMLSDEHGLNISQRNITVSTCGIVPRIYDLAEEKLQITPGTFPSCGNAGKKNGTDAHCI